MANNPDYIPPLGSEGGPQGFPPPSEPVPPPPPRVGGDLGIRTMSSDVNSLGASGGLGAEPRTFRPKDLLGNEPVFSPQIPPTPQMPPLSQSKAHPKALIISISAVAGIVVLGAAAYFLFFGGEAPVPPTEPPAPPVEPVPPVEPPVPPVEPVPTPPVEPPAPVPPTFQHQTFFPTSSNVASANVSLPNLAATDINSGITAAFTSEAKVPILKELVFSFNNVNVTAQQFLAALVPTLNASFLDAKLDKDFTAFAYKDKDGVWPGYVFKLNPETPPGQARPEVFTTLEQSALKFFLSDPGAPKSTDFKQGFKSSPNVKDIRYMLYTKAGASFNIAWVQVSGVNYAIVSTSFNGINEAIRLLGF